MSDVDIKNALLDEIGLLLLSCPSRFDKRLVAISEGEQIGGDEEAGLHLVTFRPHAVVDVWTSDGHVWVFVYPET